MTIVKYDDITDARQAVTNAIRTYLERFGWKYTCSTPGSYWMWKRDFGGKYGVVIVPQDLAIRITQSELDEDE